MNPRWIQICIPLDFKTFVSGAPIDSMISAEFIPSFIPFHSFGTLDLNRSKLIPMHSMEMIAIVIRFILSQIVEARHPA